LYLCNCHFEAVYKIPVISVSPKKKGQQRL
jgi:hypothetical protein